MRRDAADAARLDGFLGQLPVHRRCAQRSWHVLAPDWRGYGQSQWLNRRYWFADYYADLDYLLDRYSPGVPARIVGHSMGGAVASIYGGARPERIAGLLMVDFLGLLPNEAREAPGRIRDWLDHSRATPQLRAYASREQLAARLLQFNKRLLPERAAFLATHCASQCPTASSWSPATPGTRSLRPTSTGSRKSWPAGAR
jgi:pimeloyl-ACP methyl ester carboxylesterase